MDDAHQGTAHDGLALLGPGATAFVDSFNEHGGHVRLVAVLSPTCGPCLFGARAVHATLITFPQADVRVSLVWTPMLAGDTAAAAAQASTMIADARVRHFYDPARQVGRAIAAGLGGAGQVAWDIYLFYAKEAVWGAAAPPPVRYVHQLGHSWAAPAYRRHGAALVAALQQTMQQVAQPTD